MNLHLRARHRARAAGPDVLAVRSSRRQGQRPPGRLALAALTLALTAALSPGPAWADALIKSDAMQATTIAEFFVEPEQVTVELEIGAADLAAFANLMPDDLYERLGNAPRPLGERLAEFFAVDFPILGPDGEPLAATVTEIGPRPRVRRDEITGEPLPDDGAEPEPTVFVRLTYAIEGEPSELVFSSPPGSSVGFVAYHSGVAVTDFRYLSRGFRLLLDWEDPFYSRFEARALRRQYFAPMSGFLYVEPYEVRKEIIARPLDLQRWVDLGLEGRETIPVELQPELKRRVAEFLREHQTVVIDGEEVEPELARIHFLERTLRTSRVIEPPEELSVYSAVLGVIFVYPTSGLPEKVTMDWDLWDERLQQVPVSAVDQAGGLPSTLEPDWRVLEWTNFLKNPELPTLLAVVPPPGALARAARWLAWLLLAATLAGLFWARQPPRTRLVGVALLAGVTGLVFWTAREAAVDEERGREVVGALLHNIYRAFDHRDDETIYDTLARSVSGDLLEQIYLETRRGLTLESQGGARAKVKEIELIALEAEPAEGGAFRADVTWDVAGSVGHWGHVHQRRNRVRAELIVAPEDGAWKVIDLDVLEEERL